MNRFSPDPTFGTREKPLNLAVPEPAAESGETPWNAAFLDPRARRRSSSHVVFGQSNRFRWTGAGNLSVKATFDGHAMVEAGGGLHRLEPDRYLVLNQGREYTYCIENDRPTDVFSVFFDPEMTASAIRSYLLKADRQLDDPFGKVHPEIEFFERVYGDDNVAEHLRSMREELPAFHNDTLWLQENLHHLLEFLLSKYEETWKEVESVQAVRAVTKEELYRRLYKARDFAYATLDQPVSLDDLAYVACLSTNYFLRSFKALFKQTPHQFIIEKRLQRAQHLLRESDQSVSEICLAVGFQSLGSFSWLFKKRIGLSPEAFRRAELENPDSD
jgi:AraC family transcriptional regulator